MVKVTLPSEKSQSTIPRHHCGLALIIEHTRKVWMCHRLKQDSPYDGAHGSAALSDQQKPKNWR